MIFVIVAIFILIVSFVIALVSLIREQSKIEKETATPRDNQIEPKEEIPALPNERISQDVENTGVNQQPPFVPQSQPQPTAPSLDWGVSQLKKKPWWEKEIQKRDEEPQGHAIDWQNSAKLKAPAADVLKTEQSPKVLEPHDRFAEQTSQEKAQNLQGSFSVSDLKRANHES